MDAQRESNQALRALLDASEAVAKLMMTGEADRHPNAYRLSRQLIMRCFQDATPEVVVLVAGLVGRCRDLEQRVSFLEQMLTGEGVSDGGQPSK